MTLAKSSGPSVFLERLSNNLAIRIIFSQTKNSRLRIKLLPTLDDYVADRIVLEPAQRIPNYCNGWSIPNVLNDDKSIS